MLHVCGSSIQLYSECVYYNAIDPMWNDEMNYEEVNVLLTSIALRAAGLITSNIRI